MEVLDLIPINDMDLVSSPRETVTQDETLAGLTKNGGHFLWIDILFFILDSQNILLMWIMPQR